MLPFRANLKRWILNNLDSWEVCADWFGWEAEGPGSELFPSLSFQVWCLVHVGIDKM